MRSYLLIFLKLSFCGFKWRPAHDHLLLGRQVVPVLDQRQVSLDFEFDKSQRGLKLFLARELEARLFVLGVGIFRGG
jgi:hypothetical protein